MEYSVHTIDDLIDLCLKDSITIRIGPCEYDTSDTFVVQVDKGVYHSKTQVDNVPSLRNIIFNSALKKSIDGLIEFERCEKEKENA